MPHRNPNIFQLLVFEFFCAAFPTALFFGATFISQKHIDIEHVVGNSAVVLIGLGVFLAAMADLMIDHGIHMDWFGIASLVLLSVMLATVAAGTYADVLPERGIPIDYRVWLGFQVGVTMLGLIYCAVVKSFQLSSERTNGNSSTRIGGP